MKITHVYNLDIARRLTDLSISALCGNRSILAHPEGETLKRHDAGTKGDPLAPR